MKSTKAITLIALIITIIILLILAGVTIGTKKNSRLLSKTKEAHNEYNSAKQEEDNKLNEYEIAMDSNEQGQKEKNNKEETLTKIKTKDRKIYWYKR